MSLSKNCKNHHYAGIVTDEHMLVYLTSVATDCGSTFNGPALSCKRRFFNLVVRLGFLHKVLSEHPSNKRSTQNSL